MSLLKTNVSAALLVAMIALPGGVMAEDDSDAAALNAGIGMEQIEQAWAAQDFVRVRQGLQQLAETDGQPFAMYRYAYVLIQGLGGPRDVPAAVQWLEQAVEANQADAAVLLAKVLLSQMEGGPARDPDRAAQLLKSVAPRGNTEAQYYLGLLYQEGVGVPQDREEALNWLLAAAEGGKVEAQFELSRIYSTRKTGSANAQNALRWLREAANQNHAEAQYFLGYAYDQGRGLPADKKEGFDWLYRSAERGYVPAQVVIGRKYLNGEGIGQNAAEAERWLRRAADSRSAEAMTELAAAYLSGDQFEANPPLALQLYRQAEQYGSPKAMVGLGSMLENGQGGAEVDIPAAVAFYREALELRSAEAAIRLGALAGQGKLDGLLAPQRAVPWAVAAADQGDSAARDWLRSQARAGVRPAQTAMGVWLASQAGPYDEAVGFLTAAAKNGDPAAQHQLGLLYISGQGVEADYIQAHTWLNIAATGGSRAAADKRTVLGDLMTADQIATAQTAARVFFEQAKAPANAPASVEDGSDTVADPVSGTDK